MRDLTKLSDRNLLLTGVRVNKLLINMITAYPYKYYPKEKFEKRRGFLENICNFVNTECEVRKLLLNV